MVAFQVKNFGGTFPKMSDRLLPDNLGVKAENTKLYSGEIRAWRTPKMVTNIGGPVTTTYRVPYGGTDYWLNWPDDIDIIRTPLVNDSYERRYWTGESGKGPQVNSAARIAAGDPSFDLGVPVNTASITVTPGGTGSPNDETRFYVITYVTDWGEEGVPCNPVSATGDPSTSWTIGNLPTATIPANNVTKLRFYRTITGYNSVDFFYVGEQVIGSATFTDSLSNADAALNNLLESTTFDPPPATLKGLISHPNGFLVGFSERDVYMSEPYRPHAWPVSYITSVAYNIVGLGLVGTTVIVLTESASYALTGVHPSTMSLAQSKVVEPCISKRSIVSFSRGVIYASPNGLIFTDGLNVRNATLPLMTVEYWDSTWKSGTLMGAKYDQRYIAADGKKGFIYDFEAQKEAFTTLSFTYDVDQIYTDETTGKVYLGFNQAVWQFDPSDTGVEPYSWKSKVFTAPKPVNFGVCKLRCDVPDALSGTDPGARNQLLTENAALGQPSATLGRNVIGGAYDKTISYQPYRGVLGGSGLINPDSLSSGLQQLIIRVYADDQLIYEMTDPSVDIFNLPSGFKTKKWQFEIVSNLDFQSVTFASNRTQLRSV